MLAVNGILYFEIICNGNYTSDIRELKSEKVTLQEC